MAKYVLIASLIIGIVMLATQELNAQVTIKERMELTDERSSFQSLQKPEKNKVQPQFPYYPNFRRIGQKIVLCF